MKNETTFAITPDTLWKNVIWIFANQTSSIYYFGDLDGDHYGETAYGCVFLEFR